MPVCAFCGHDNRADARSCVACGNVFTDAPPLPPSEPGPRPEPEPEPSLAGLYDPAEVARPARQAVVMIAVAALAALAAAVGVGLDAAEALDEIDARPFLLEGPQITPRTDVLTLAELSLLAGVLVMLGGWAQQVAAARALLAGGTPRHTPAWMLRAWLVPGPNVVLPGAAVRELWEDASPRGDAGPPPSAVRRWAVVFGVALAARYGTAAFGLVASPELHTTSGVLIVAAVLVVPLLLWVVALGLTARVVGAVTSRQAARAASLASASG